jgi:hypothetical protein
MADRTPTETMVACMTAFGECEPTRVFVIWADENGDLRWSSSSPRLLSTIIGMLECVKAVLTKEFLNLKDD